MFVYHDTVWQGTPECCQESNLNIPSSHLERVSAAGGDFVLLSRAEVFDMSGMKMRIYSEKSEVCPACEAGQMLSIMEKKVLEYENGYVIRACHIVSDIIGEIREAVSKMPTGISPTMIRPVAIGTVKHIAELAPYGRWGDRKKIVHVPMPEMMSLPAIVYGIYGGETDFDVDEDGETISQDYDSALDSEIFCDVFGADEMLRCLHANGILVKGEMFGGQ